MNHPKFVLYTTLCLTILFLFVKSTKVNVTLIDANSTRSTEDSNLLCIEPNHREICSGNGVCMNGTCHCWGLDHEIDPFFKYSGKYCEECPYCKGQRCGKFMPCVQCVLNDKTRNCSLKCSSVNYSVVGVLKIEDGGDKLCEREDENGCVFLFKYIYNNRNALELFIEKGKTCLDGRKYTTYVFWGVVVYLLLLLFLIPKICDQCEQSNSSKLLYIHRRVRNTNCDIIRIS